MRAYDGGEPPRSAYNVVTITVNRNLNAPRFIVPGPIQNYQVTANRQLETIGLSDIIYQVQAEDDDSVSQYTLCLLSDVKTFKNDTLLCPMVFWVHCYVIVNFFSLPADGNVHIVHKKNLRKVNENNYKLVC